MRPADSFKYNWSVSHGEQVVQDTFVMDDILDGDCSPLLPGKQVGTVDFGSDPVTRFGQQVISGHDPCYNRQTQPSPPVPGSSAKRMGCPGKGLLQPGFWTVETHRAKTQPTWNRSKE